MNRKDFITKFKFPTPKPSNNLINFVNKLQENYPNCSISLEKVEKKHSTEKDDFISIRLNNIENPIDFKIPAKKFDLSIYQSSPDYDTLNYRYDLYNTIYKDKIIEQFKAERKYLMERFPNVVFNTKIRQKSKFSYEDKIIERMISNHSLPKDEKKSCFIRDVIGGRHIISFVNGDNSPDVLEDMCFKFREALREFRENEKASNFNIILEKDYITNPKPNGYQSIHFLSQDSENADCTYETQIRTFDMEEKSKKDEAIAHNTYKPLIIDEFASLRVPNYISITPYNDDNGNPIVVTPPHEESFYHFYGFSFPEYSKQLYRIMPIINEIKSKLYSKKHNKEKEIE